MAASRALFRLAFLILIIPVGLLVTLHFFGENRMEIPVLQSLKGCDLPAGTVIYLSGDSLSRAQQNQITRVNRTLEKKRLTAVNDASTCFGDTVALLLVDKDKQLRGTYRLEQSEVNRLFAELDILRMNESYGEGVRR